MRNRRAWFAAARPRENASNATWIVAFFASLALSAIFAALASRGTIASALDIAASASARSPTVWPATSPICCAATSSPPSYHFFAIPVNFFSVALLAWSKAAFTFGKRPLTVSMSRSMNSAFLSMAARTADRRSGSLRIAVQSSAWRSTYACQIVYDPWIRRCRQVEEALHSSDKGVRQAQGGAISEVRQRAEEVGGGGRGTESLTPIR